MTDKIQLPEGVERFITIRCSQCKQQKGEGNPDHCPAGVAWPGPYAPHRFRKVEFVDVSDIPAIIAQEREKWEAELTSAGAIASGCKSLEENRFEKVWGSEVGDVIRAVISYSRGNPDETT